MPDLRVDLLPRPRWTDGHFNMRGALEFISAAKVLSAIGLVERGEVISLSRPLDSPAVPPGGRPRPRLVRRQENEHRSVGDEQYVVVNDDILELALQASSHWDSLGHCGFLSADEPSSVFYGGASLGDLIEPRGGFLGIDALGPAIITRGVLLDFVASTEAANGYLPGDFVIDRECVLQALDFHEIRLEQGDAVCIYTGFEARCAQSDAVGLPELVAGLDSTTLPIWEEAAVSAIVADNTAVEGVPVDYGVHVGALRNLGIPLGELWALQLLAEACRRDNKYEFLFVSVPLSMPGAFGSPANAVAVR